jgi:hypothetical protein
MERKRFLNQIGAFFVTCLLILLSSQLAYAGCTGSSPTWTTTPDYTSVNTCVANAKTGDTINVSAGDGGTWTSVIQLGSKKLTIVGAGIDSTIIAGSSGSRVLELGTGGSTLSDMTITNGYIYADGQDFIVGKIKFNNTESTVYDGIQVFGIVANTHPTGVIHSCQFINTTVIVYGSYNTMDSQAAVWALPYPVGDQRKMVYIEGNTFTKSIAGVANVIDGTMSARSVFRYNTVTSSASGTNQALYIEAHSVQGDANRGYQRWEYYNNVINNTEDIHYMPYRIRAGTGVVFNNSTIGNWSTNSIGYDNVRSYESRDTAGKCDGTSRWDGNTAITNGTGTHTGSDSSTTLTDSTKSWTANTLVGYTVTNETDSGLAGGCYCIITANTSNTVTCTLASGQWNSGDSYKITNGYPCRDQIGRGYDATQWENDPVGTYTQVLMPAYSWNNTGNFSANVAAIVINNTDDDIQANRDFYDYKASFDGTSGVGRGLLSARPVTCITGVAYFATDQGTLGTLYKCTATNTWTVYYTPYTCPHPLTGLTGSCTTAAGTAGYNK